MAQPPPYNRQTSFSNLQALNPAGQPPGNLMDAEFNAVKTALDAIEANLANIQNDDTTLGNETVGPAQLSPQLVLGFGSPTAWVTGQAYTSSPASTVLQGTAIYICLVSHTSGTFATDLADGKWLLVFDLSTFSFGAASQITVVPSGNVQSNVQVSLNNLDTNKAALSHTHLSTQITDSTVAGRAMLTAANATAQGTLLGLGSLAFLNSLTITNLPNQVTLTGSVAPVVLSLDQNDYTPTGWATLSTLFQGASTAVTLTGFGATVDGDIKVVINSGAFPITIAANSTASSTANRVLIPSPITLRPGQGMVMRCAVGGINGWVVLTPTTVSPARGTAKNLRMGNVANYLGDSAPSSPNVQVYLRADSVVMTDGAGSPWSAAISTTIDATTVGANGIDTGALGASAWYSIWAIGNAATNTVAGLISTSATAPTLPSGYSFSARVGWMRTDGSSHFLTILQYGHTARYTGTMPQIATGAGTYASGVAVANFVPPTATKIAVATAGTLGASGSLTVGPNASSSPIPISLANGTGAGTIQANTTAELVLEGANIFYGASTAGGGSPSLSCYGWEDNF